MYVRISVDSRPHSGELRASYAQAGNELCDLKNRRRLVADVKNTFRVSASFGRLQKIAGDPENSRDARRNIGRVARKGKHCEMHRHKGPNVSSTAKCEHSGHTLGYLIMRICDVGFSAWLMPMISP
ncbi:hypothetical protein Bbelb_329650 [Branchiostoma belcheri]|nr:hypothetical protein Bbelb_329650 [Branchiostoma belcheri]